jgi:CysZ protein
VVEPSPAPKAPLPVTSGLAACLGAFRFLVRRPRTWPYALVPVIVLFLLVTGAVALAVVFIRPAVVEWLAQSAAFLGRIGAEAASWLAALLSAVLGLWLAVGLAPPLSAPALEKIVHLQERELGVPDRRELGFVSELWIGLRAQLLALALATPLFLALWIIGLLLPPLAVVVLPLKFALASLLIAYDLLDYPLTLRGVPLRERLRLMRRQWRATLGFGLAFSLLFWLPCCAIGLLPIGAAAATRLIWQMAERDPWLRQCLAENAGAGAA